MSAYGPISRPSAPSPAPVLLPRSLLLPATQDASERQAMTVFPLTRDTAPRELVEYLGGVFNAVVEEGKTYPQMGVQSYEEFANYFFGADCFVSLLDPTLPPSLTTEGVAVPRTEEGYSLEKVRAGRDWQECVAGMFYVKPNYPGRSSHICNGGFVVPSRWRGMKIGVNLGRAFLYYAPKLGYRASVFNLVYVTNIASLRCWDQLGFKRVGLIPGAGLLRTGEGGKEEFVDAVVYWGDFETIAVQE